MLRKLRFLFALLRKVTLWDIVVIIEHYIFLNL